MSAIAGLLCLDGSSADEASLRRMVEAMAHRGPDGRAVWYQGEVGLGHGMLYTTEESLHEVLPFRDEAADLAITAHARVDNRAELIAELDVAPRTPTVTSASRPSAPW